MLPILAVTLRLDMTANSIYVKVDVTDDNLHTGPGNAYKYDNVCIYFDVFNIIDEYLCGSTQMYSEMD